LLHRFRDQFLLLEPLCCSPVQRLYLARERQTQPLLEELREEGMVAVPLAVVIERHQKEIGSFRPLEERLRLAAAGQRCTERGAESLEQRGLQQEALHGFWLAAKHVLGEIVHQVAMAAAEASQKLVHIGTPSQRERRQLQSRHPPLGALR